MVNSLQESYKRYSERLVFYKGFGYDVKEERKSILEKACPIFGDILEVGTGKGYFAIELAEEGYSFVSVDISREEQEFARLNINYLGFNKLADFRIGNAEYLDFSNASFGTVFSVNTIHHIADPLKAAEEMTRVVAPEGKLILSDFNPEGLKVIDKIHAAEGRKHAAASIRLPEIGNYLERMQFGVQRYKGRFQETLVACRRSA